MEEHEDPEAWRETVEPAARGRRAPLRLVTETDAPVSGLVPPHDLDAEAAVLAAVLLDASRLTTISFLKPEHFYSESHRRIYEAASELLLAGEVVDVVTVASRLKDRQRLQQVGGMPYLGEVINSQAVIQNVRAHAIVVYEKWRLRSVVQYGAKISLSYAGVTDVQEHLEGIVKHLAALTRNSPVAPNEPQSAVVARLIAQMQDVRMQSTASAFGHATLGIPTGISCLDAATMGLQPGHKVTAMAMRGRGKTSFGIQLAMYAAGYRRRSAPLASARVRVKFFSTEMTRKELGIKMVSHVARVDSRRIERQEQTPTLTMEEWDRVLQAQELISTMDFDVDDRTAISADDIVGIVEQDQAAAAASRTTPIGLVVVDYIQNLAWPKAMRGGKEREDQAIGYGTKALKDMAQKLQIPVLELAQMNPPDPAKSKSGRPYEGLARKCLVIEEAANMVLCLWRKRRDTLTDYGLAITKFRNGSEVDLDLEFEPEHSTFIDPDSRGLISAFEGL